VPKIVIAEVTTCSFELNDMYQPFLPARVAADGALELGVVAYNEFRHSTAVPAQLAASEDSHVLDVGLS
jgi:hypothetical protein